MAVVLALDVGGTKLGAAVVDETGRMLGRGRVPSPTGTDPEQLYEALLACAAAALRGADVIPGDLSGIGVAAAGPMVWPSGEVSPLNMPAWRGYPLRKRLAEEFASDRVLIHNDAVGLTVGEHWKGAGSGTANLLGMTVSTGVGGGLILDGRLNHGASGNAGHVGHVVVELHGPVCACGGRGCLEAIASGPNTVRRALDEGWRPGPGVVADGVALAAAAAAGDAIALRNVARAGRAVGTAIASCASLLDLEVAAIVGGFSQSGPPFWEPLQQAFATHAGLPFAAACRVVPGQLGEAAGLLGAAAFVLVPDRYGWDPDPAPGH
ncbi:MAG TPA: ROK family protein [Actinomycetes bacterium]|jgi:glucokinase|nr:ROK family protein [Actinomycetes bacterium]